MATFTVKALPDNLVFSLNRKALIGTRQVPCAEWKTQRRAPRRALARLQSLLEEGNAVAGPDCVQVPHATIATLDAALQTELGLPELADVALKLGFERTIDNPKAKIVVEWLHRGFRAVVPIRTGLLVQIAGSQYRLSRELFQTVEAVDAFNSTEGQPLERRLAAWFPVQEAIGRSTGEAVTAEGQARSLVLYQAGSMALDLEERASGLHCAPVLMSRRHAVSLEDDAPDDLYSEESAFANAKPLVEPLLTEDQNKAFRAGFDSGGRTRGAYKLGRNSYVLIDPDLRTALDVVQRVRQAPEGERRAFVRNPRAAIAKALNAEDPHSLASVLFIETKAYSDRVTGLGLWEKPKLPWLPRTPNDWLPERVPVLIAGKQRELSREEATSVIHEIRTADEEGAESVQVLDARLSMPDARELRRTIEAYQAEPSAATPFSQAKSPDVAQEPGAKLVLTLKPNHEAPEYVVGFSPRQSLVDESGISKHVATALKAHQVTGFEWLVACWRAGWPGVLLADDMGLGKTLQALSFMAWLRANKQEALRRGNGGVATGPLLVVAPTALLDNWKREVETHLMRTGLGSCLEAYGGALRKLKDSEGRIDPVHLQTVDWVLTTYETLAGAHTSFGRVRFSLVLFDEVQKIKDATTINAHAAKTLNADFVLGMTGTPIENGLADLWSITDALTPGYLGDLKGFAATYDAERQDSLVALKAKLEARPGGAPPILLRRMKEEVLDALPRKVILPRPANMPARQAERYKALIDSARSESRSTPGAKLKLIHEMRGVSLHPDGPAGPTTFNPDAVESWISQSARLATTVAILREIEARGEKALIFVESLEMQEAIAEAASILFELPRRPSIINGGTPGRNRQGIVDRFQQGSPGFDFLVLSPKAAGVGLNITAASHIVHLSRWWNPAVEDQCNDRAYRIGQTRDVSIHLPMAVHPAFGPSSFDRILDRLLERKRQLSRHMLAPPSSTQDADEVYREALDTDLRRSEAAE